MYSAFLLVHSWLRWAVILLGLIVLVRSLTGAVSKRPWTGADDRAGLLFVTTLDVQLLIGLLLYFVLSPFTKAAMQDFGAAMGNAGLRFFAVEHVFGMVIGLGLAHIARVRIRKMADPIRKHNIALLTYGLAIVAMLVSIPWPGMPAGRPLFRW